MKRIVILRHERERPGRHSGGLVDALSAAWRKEGLHVSSVYGINEHPPADLLIPNVDLTRTPPPYVEYIRSFPAAVNRDVFDISKRRISAHLLHRGDDYRGPVIVKTDNNYGGLPEYRVSQRRHPFLVPLRRTAVLFAEYVFGRRLAWRRELHHYPVYNSLAEVPAGVFSNPALIVERFLPEQDGGRYLMRHYLFLGDRLRSVRVAGSTPFLKRTTCVPVDEGLEVPEMVLRMRRELRLEYGKIDYTMHAGEPVILDVNRTPGTPDTPEATARVVRDLADGIWSLLPK